VKQVNDPERPITYHLRAFVPRPLEIPNMGAHSHIWRLIMTKSKGFGLLELMVTLVIVSLLLTLGIPAYSGYSERAKNAKAVGDIGALSVQIERFRLQNNDRIPLSLAELPIDVPLDPWKRPYDFLNIPSVLPNKAQLRKDGALNPLNTDFDLYSRGEDGDSAGPLSAQKSRDDIVRANNGAYIGLGEDY